MSSETVKVMVRARPFNERESKTNAKNCVEVDTANFQVTLNHPSDPDLAKAFGYDSVFPPNVAQQTVYEQSAFPIVECVLDGYNGTIFAYGQTGCGKTHTMMGNTAREELRGIIPRAFEHIFGKIGTSTQKNYLIRCSYIEIYNEEIHDLIGKDWNIKLELKEMPEKGVFIKDVAMHVVKSVDEIERLMNTGTKNRSVGETAMNKDSSRSHSIFTIYIEASQKDEKGNDTFTAGKLNLVDLAGSERQSKTQASGDRLKEANKINLSLSALGNVISALVDGKGKHVPYRDSKLTRLLQDSLGGNTKTVMIANVSPASDSYDETLGTLRYASRAKNIKNQPKVNQDPKDALICEYAEEIKRLKMMLEGGGGAPATTITGQNNGKKEAAPRSDKGAAGKSDNSGKLAAIESELKAREQVINDERSKREKLEAMLKEMEQNFLHGGQTPANGNEKKKYEEMSNKLQKSEKEHEKALQERQQKEEEVLMMEKKYGSLQEEVEELRKLTRKLRKKYKGSCQEVKDLEREHELNREDLFDTIRLLEKDVKINNAIIVNLLSPQELDHVRSRAKWVDERNEFVIPPFIVKQKKVKFPKLPGHQAAQMMQDEWNNRDLEFTDSTQNPDEASEYGPDEDFEDYNPKSHYKESTPIKRDGNSKSQPKIGVHVRSNKLIGDRKGLGDNYNININNYNYMTPPIHPKSINSHSVNSSGNRNSHSSAEYYDSFSSASPVTRDKMTSDHKPTYKKNPKNITLEPINNAPHTDDDSYAFPGQHQAAGGLSTKGSIPRQKISPLKSLAPLNSSPSGPRGVKVSINATLVYNDDYTDSDGVNEANDSISKGKMRLEPLKAN